MLFVRSLLALGLAALSAVHAITPGFPYGSQKVRGVNIGGWLVTEPWITPSLYDKTGNPQIVDEYTFCQFQDKGKAAAALQAHWNSFITQSDFQQIAAAGLNHVRIPIGYWAYDVSGGEPFVQGQAAYLDKAIGWAEAAGLKVIVDLHGAPGSQNGFDNSGQKLPAPTWQTKQSNIDRTNAIIKRLANAYKDRSNVVVAIAPLNEYDDPLDTEGPMSSPSRVRRYWYDSYGNIRYPYGTDQQSNTVEVLHDAFQPLSYWQGFMPSSNYQGVIMDTHRYQMFSDAENRRTDQQHIQSACAIANDLNGFSLWVVVGEWTPAATDCAKYLNGRGVGSRYDGTYPGSSRIGSCTGKTGSASTFSAAYKTFLRQYWEAQTITYEKGNGWIQWTWKAENADEWSYQAGLANGWIPKNPTSRQYPTICG